MNILNLYVTKYGGGAQKVFRDTHLGLKEHKFLNSYLASLDSSSDLVLKKSYFGFINYFLLVFYIKKRKIDILHYHGGIGLGVLFPFFIYLISKTDVNVVFTAHNYGLICSNQKRYHENKNIVCDRCLGGSYHYFIQNCESRSIHIKLFKFIYSRLLNDFISRGDVKVIAPSYFVSSKITESIKIDVKTIYNPVHLDAGEDSDSDADANLNIDGIVFIGRLVPEKGVLYFVNEVIRNKEDYIGRKIHIIGDGRLRNTITSMIKESEIEFFMHGFCEEQKIRNILKTCRVIVVPSLWDEAFGLVVLEGVLNKCIPVVANKGALPDIVNSIGVGSIFEFEDNKLNHLLNENFESYFDNEWENVFLKVSKLSSRDKYVMHLLSVYNDERDD